MLHGGDVYTEGILKGKKLIDFSSNINPMGVPETFKNNINEALEAAIRYPDVEYRKLNSFIRNYIEDNYNVRTYYENVVPGNGAAEIIEKVISKFKHILIIVPSFAEYELISEMYECSIYYSYLNENMECNYEDIYIKLASIDAVILGNPNNPNGLTINKEKFIPILNYCEESNKTVIVDEAFIEFTGDTNRSFVSEIEKYKCLFIIRALTKFFALPGVRLGYGISKNSELVESIRKSQNPWSINCFAEIAAKYVLKDKNYIAQSLKWISSEKEFLTKELELIEFIEKVHETQCNFILCKLKNINCNELYERCLQRGIVIRKADNFRGLDERYVRFAVKDRKNNMSLLQALRDIVI